MRRMLESHWDHLMELCSSDTKLSKLTYYSQWVKERAARASSSRSRSEDITSWTNDQNGNDDSAQDHREESTSTPAATQWARKDYDIAQLEDLYHPISVRSATSVLPHPVHSVLRCTNGPIYALLLVDFDGRNVRTPPSPLF